MHRIGENYATLRRYSPEFFAALKLRAAPAAKNVLNAIEVLRDMNTAHFRLKISRGGLVSFLMQLFV